LAVGSTAEDNRKDGRMEDEGNNATKQESNATLLDAPVISRT
jgi:hypothetical protein